MCGHAGQSGRIAGTEKPQGKDRTSGRDADIAAKLSDVTLKEFAEQTRYSFPWVQIYDGRTCTISTRVESIQGDDGGFIIRIEERQAGVIARSFGDLREKQIRITFPLRFDGGQPDSVRHSIIQKAKHPGRIRRGLKMDITIYESLTREVEHLLDTFLQTRVRSRCPLYGRRGWSLGTAACLKTAGCNPQNLGVAAEVDQRQIGRISPLADEVGHKSSSQPGRLRKRADQGDIRTVPVCFKADQTFEYSRSRTVARVDNGIAFKICGGNPQCVD